MFWEERNCQVESHNVCPNLTSFLGFHVKQSDLSARPRSQSSCGCKFVPDLRHCTLHVAKALEFILLWRFKVHPVPA